MNITIRRSVALYALLVLAACGGSGAPSNAGIFAPQPSPSPTAGTENISASGATTIVPLPNIGGIYGGQVILPAGSGNGTLTFSLNPPPGVPQLSELTPQPQVAYLTITAQSAFTLSAFPGLNVSVPSGYTSIDLWLNYFANGSWSNSEQQTGWPSTASGTSLVCFKVQGAPVSLAPGQSLYLGIDGDSVLPTPPPSATPAPCPQSP